MYESIILWEVNNRLLFRSNQSGNFCHLGFGLAFSLTTRILKFDGCFFARIRINLFILQQVMGKNNFYLVVSFVGSQAVVAFGATQIEHSSYLDTRV